MRITNIELLDVNTQSETIYDVKIIIDNCVCLTGIKINLYTDELIVVYPDTIAPVDNKTKIKLDNIILAEALSALETELFKFGFEKIILEIDDANTLSERVAIRSGYKLEKRLPMDSWAKCIGKCDTLVYAKYQKMQ